MESVVAATAPPSPAAPGDWLPAETPLPMPIQSLREGRLARTSLPSMPAGMWLRRVCVIGVTAALTLTAAYQIWWLLRGQGTDVLEGLLLLLFVALFAWIAQSFVSALAGFVNVLAHPHVRLGLSPHDPLPVPASRTALLMPTYNEAPDRLLAGLQAIPPGPRSRPRRKPRSPSCASGSATVRGCSTGAVPTMPSARPAISPNGCAASVRRIRTC